MQKIVSLAAVVALLCVSAVRAEELKSGLATGEGIGPFQVVKVSAAPEDGVKTGAELCYRCKYGARPMVMVFTRSADAVAGLSKELDSAVTKYADKKLSAFVNVMGADREAAEKAAEKFSTSSKLTAVPVVVPVEFENGPGDYGINPKAEVTVIVAVGSKVTASYGFSKGDLKEEGVKKVLADVAKLVK